MWKLSRRGGQVCWQVRPVVGCPLLSPALPADPTCHQFHPARTWSNRVQCEKRGMVHCACHELDPLGSRHCTPPPDFVGQQPHLRCAALLDAGDPGFPSFLAVAPSHLEVRVVCMDEQRPLLCSLPASHLCACCQRFAATRLALPSSPQQQAYTHFHADLRPHAARAAAKLGRRPAAVRAVPPPPSARMYCL